ncbi:Predicted membrane protein [Actinobacillus pleuropneumoniae serovar 2 str. S1536]|nr:Predicted membrane protein [Actinobacillus pleuropneumoniae serovar 2 str. S1536]
MPIIQKSGSIQVVPLAISFGFIINLVVPILLAFFIGLT